MDIYSIITQKILEQIEQGVCPWSRPWTGASIEEGGAINYVSRQPYSLINQMLLQKEGEWLSFKQIQDKGGKIKKGAKSSMVVWYKMLEYKDEKIADDGELIEKLKRIPVLKYYNVFHIDDVEGIESKITKEPKDEPKISPIEAGEEIIRTYLDNNPNLSFHARLSNQAYYSPSLDEVVVPKLSQYPKNKEEYYSTAFHELGHSTMRADRCDRKDGATMMREEYSREELVAELCAAMLCAAAGMTSEKRLQNSAAYLKGWASRLKEDTKAIVWASSRAEAAAKYILFNQKPNNNEK